MDPIELPPLAYRTVTAVDAQSRQWRSLCRVASIVAVIFGLLRFGDGYGPFFYWDVLWRGSDILSGKQLVQLSMLPLAMAVVVFGAASIAMATWARRPLLWCLLLISTIGPFLDLWDMDLQIDWHAHPLRWQFNALMYELRPLLTNYLPVILIYAVLRRPVLRI
ncbi:MAG TPA: hypothetical protein VIL86_09305 [Tepidisphaeraceae bacterium]|jgi:hypothetical protein